MSQIDTDSVVGESDDEKTSIVPFPRGWLTFGFFAFLLVWDLGLLFAAWPWTWQNKLMPVLVGITLAVLISIQLLRLSFPGIFELFEGEEDEDTDGELASIHDDESDTIETLPKPVQEKYQILTSAWIVSLAVFIYLFGFVLVLPVYLSGFIWYFKRDAKLAGGLTAAFALFIYLLFVVVLEVQLWAGAVF